MNKRTEQAENTRRKLLYTAYQLIREEGYPALTIRKLCERSGVSTGAFYHHYSSKEDLITQGFMTFDEKLEADLKHPISNNPLDMIKYIILSLTDYIYENGEGFAKELYISQLSIEHSFITKKDRLYYRSVLEYVKKAQAEHLFKNSIDPIYITNVLIRIGRGTILDWCLNDYTFDLHEESKKDLENMMGQFLL